MKASIKHARWDLTLFAFHFWLVEWLISPFIQQIEQKYSS
jgi:hypothetical protein